MSNLHFAHLFVASWNQLRQAHPRPLFWDQVLPDRQRQGSTGSCTKKGHLPLPPHSSPGEWPHLDISGSLPYLPHWSMAELC